MQEFVLSDGEIVRLKHYINRKHHSLDPKRRASVFADAAHRIIESRLPSFPEEVKKRLCYELLSKFKESLVIQADDVLQHCMSLDLSKDELVSSLAEWACARSTLQLQEEVVRDILLQWSQEELTAVSIQALEREWEQQNLNSHMEIAVAVVNEPVVPYWKKVRLNRKVFIASLPLFAVILGMMLILSLEQRSSTSISTAVPINNQVIRDLKPVDGIPKELKYVSIDKKRLQHYLKGKNSILAEEPYLTAIVEAAKKYDIHPLLLFAITGQEQGFVSKDHKKVKEIANNPFNVFGSWESYNTTIASSANIAAKTVANISNRRPGTSHPIQWLNQTYAEDPNWWKGVTWFFNEIKLEVEDEPFNWPQ